MNWICCIAIFTFICIVTKVSSYTPPIWLTQLGIAPYCPLDLSECVSSLFASMILNSENHHFETTITSIDGKELQNPVNLEIDIGPDMNHSAILRYELVPWRTIGNTREEFEYGEDCIFEKRYDSELCCITPRSSFRRYLHQEKDQYQVYRFTRATKIYQCRIRISVGSEKWTMILQIPGQNTAVTETRKEGTNIVNRYFAIGTMVVIESRIEKNLWEAAWLLHDIRTNDKSWSDLSTWFPIDFQEARYPTIRLGMTPDVYASYVQCSSNKNDLLQFHDIEECIDDQFCEVRNIDIAQYMSHSTHMYPESIALHQGSAIDPSTGRKNTYISGYIDRESLMVKLIVRNVDFASS